jgi:hypothetical protein
MRASLLTFVLALFLAGCQVSPVISGKVTSGEAVDQGLFADRLHSKTWVLTQGQLDQIAVWLQGHNSGWSTLLATPPTPTFIIRLHYADGSRKAIQLFSANENWKRALIIQDRVTSISNEDRERLLQLVKEIPNG